ncbi:phage major capsid protein [Lacticaseibacillus suilingensis]|uniref:phage major capsid protein n=1 Tax=Lacticaseibacillus suilingensis TaxID=2799577 RepID=UPI0022E81BBE|nr:phage major capsid protein [Lacticaseibacillus suilingensis]
MAFDPDVITMQDAKNGYIPTNLSDEIITNVKTGSAIMKLAKARPMTKPREEFTFMSGVGAYWVDEGNKISTSKPTWLKGTIEAHKMAVIIPTTKENLNQSVSNFFELMRPEIAEAFYKKFDQAAMFGTDSPYPQSLIGSALLAKQTTTETANKYEDVSAAMEFLEDNDLDANAIAAPRSQRRKYRSTKDEQGLPIFTSAHDNAPADLLGLPIAWAPKDSWDTTKADEFVANWDDVQYGILNGIEYEILTEATLTSIKDENGDPINLAERDMVALKATFSPAFLVLRDESVSAVVPTDGKGVASKKAARRKVVKHDILNPDEDATVGSGESADAGK